MYDPRENRIIIDGEDKTDSVKRCWDTSRPNRCHVIFCHFPKTDDGQELLLMQYQKIDFVSDRSVATLYLNPGKNLPRQFPAPPLIYPFGCNVSQ